MELDINEDEFPHHLTKLYKRPTSICLETRLFYVRIAPCAAVDKLPDHLVLHHPRRDPGTCLEINGSPIPASQPVSITLRRDRVDRDSSEVTYVATDSVRLSGGPCEFEVCDGELDLILCGSLQNWGNLESDSSRGGGWSMDCYVGSNVVGGKSAVFGGRVCSPSIEVYVAGRCSGEPVILSKTVLVSPRRKVTRQGMLDAIPEDEEVGKKGMESGGCGGVMVVRQRKLQQSMEADMGDYESDGKVIPNYYSEDYMYQDEDGQLSWFNAGVRVGVGIGLGMCVGVGIGVGLLMRSYQATTRSFRRKFF